MTMSGILAKNPSLSDARRTLSLAISALKKGDKRLASSRAVTAAVLAAGAAVGKSARHRREAEGVILKARAIVQGIVISRVASKFAERRTG